MPIASRIKQKLQIARASKKARQVHQERSCRSAKELRQILIDKIKNSRKHNRLLLLDVDGTIVNFRKLGHYRIWPRPHLRTFLRTVSKYFDIVLFSLGNAEHVEFVRQMWCAKFVKFSMTAEHQPHGFKIGDEFFDLCDDVVIVDDNRDAVCNTHLPNFIKVKKWTSGHNYDRELLRVMELLICRTKLEKFNRSK